MSISPTTSAIGAWSGGKFLHFGEALDDRRLIALLRPGDGIDTVLTADVYGEGAGDRLVGKAIHGLHRDSFCLVGAIGHDFYNGVRNGAKGFPRFTDRQLRGQDQYAAYIKTATQRALERLATDHLDLLLLHNPDRTGYSDESVWEGMQAVKDAGLTAAVGVAPGPANGFTLDLIDCIERFASIIDWAMIILNPMEPWPGELVLDAATRHGVSIISRVVDCGGLFHDDVRPGHQLAEHDHRQFRPQGWLQAGVDKLERMRPIAQRHGLTMLQLACAWDLAHPAVRCVAPTLIQEPGADAKPIEAKRAELAAVKTPSPLSEEEIAELRAIGDNTGTMALKGASIEFDGEELPDRWALTQRLADTAKRWQIAPERDLAFSA